MLLDPSVYAERRRAFMRQMQPGSAAFIPGSLQLIRSRDTHYKYRPDSDFFYFTGFREPGTALLLMPGKQGAEVIAFVQPKDPEREVWDGRRLGVEDAPGALGVDVAYAIEELEEVLQRLLTGVPVLYYGFGSYPDHDAMIQRLLPHLGNRHVQPPHTLTAPGVIAHEMRLHKDAHEVALMRKAAEVTAEGYKAAVAAIRPGAWEYEVEAALEGNYRRLGGEGSAYTPIVAGGENATILHYTENNMELKDGELILIDSGAEFQFYACDVTRTYPINGRFTPAQKAIYELVLKAQKEAIELVRVGHHVKSYHQRAVEVLTAGLVELGLLKGSVDELIAKEGYRQFYMHGTGHYLGLDTHDVGRYRTDKEEWREIQPGMVFTVEPGLYIASGTPGIDPAFYGIGVRIEDDILVTEKGQENLTAMIPKEVADIEAAFRGEAVAGRA